MSQGLSPEDHAYLNGLAPFNSTLEERRTIYATKREQYEGNALALKEIDVYDGESVYTDYFKKYRDALVANDNPTLIAELEAWFETNYPGTHR